MSAAAVGARVCVYDHGVGGVEKWDKSLCTVEDKSRKSNRGFRWNIN